MNRYGEPAATLNEQERSRAKRSVDRYRFDWVGIQLLPLNDPALLVAVPGYVYRDVGKRRIALASWDTLLARIASQPSDQEIRRERLLAMSRSGELHNRALSIIVLVEERSTAYPRSNLVDVIADKLDLGHRDLRSGERASVQAAILGMFGPDRHLSRAAIIAREWQRFDQEEHDLLFAKIVAPTILRMAAVIVGAISGAGAVAVGARIIGMITEAVLDMRDFLDLLADPETKEEDAIAHLIGLVPLISTRLELARAGLLIGFAVVQSLIAGAEAWAARMEHALGAYQHGAVSVAFEQDGTVAIPFDVIIGPAP